MIAIDEAGSGEPLVLLHGVGTNRGVWARVTPALAARATVLAPDLPGFGDSPPAGSSFALHPVADAIAGSLRERVDGPVDLVGNSLGGAVAVVLAERHPELVRRLVLAAPAGFSQVPWPAAALAGLIAGPATAVRRIVGRPLVHSGLTRRLLLWGTIAEPQRLSADSAGQMLRASERSTQVGAAVSAALLADLRAPLGSIDRPLGLIWGRQDRIVPISTVATIRSVRPDARLETIEHAAHVPQFERPTQFVAALHRLLDGPGPALLDDPGPALLDDPGPAPLDDPGPAPLDDPGPAPLDDPGPKRSDDKSVRGDG